MCLLCFLNANTQRKCTLKTRESRRALRTSFLFSNAQNSRSRGIKYEFYHMPNTPCLPLFIALEKIAQAKGTFFLSRLKGSSKQKSQKQDIKIATKKGFFYWLGQVRLGQVSFGCRAEICSFDTFKSNLKPTFSPNQFVFYSKLEMKSLKD